MQFRSEHERLWAHYFDQIGLAWEYETVTFRDGKLSYTPDFPILARTIFVEIKTYTSKRFNRFELCHAPLILIHGTPGRHYIHVKPAKAARFLPGHLKHWSHIYDCNLFQS